jgi:hypothetical protein
MALLSVPGPCTKEKQCDKCYFVRTGAARGTFFLVSGHYVIFCLYQGT